MSVIVSRLDNSSCPEALLYIGEILNTQVLVSKQSVNEHESRSHLYSAVEELNRAFMLLVETEAVTLCNQGLRVEVARVRELL